MSQSTAPILSTTQEDEEFKYDRVQIQKTEYEKFLHLGSKEDIESLLSEQNKEELNLRLDLFYSLDLLIGYLNKTKYLRIALQFPDSLVGDSVYVSDAITAGLKDVIKDETHHGHGETPNHTCKKSTGGECSGDCKRLKKEDRKRRVFILADTSYGMCCVDEVSAEHVRSDVLVHFGDSCLNSNEKLPVIYDFGCPYLNTEGVLRAFKKKYPDKEKKIVIMSDTSYNYHLQNIYNSLIDEYPNLLFSDINISSDNKAIIISPNENKNGTIPITRKMKKCFKIDGRKISGASVINDIDTEDQEILKEYSLFHITLPSASRLLYLSTIFESISILNPLDGNSISDGPFPSLMRRYRYMHIARTAGTIGILVNTLSVKNTRVLLNTVIKWIKDSGKKHYIFAVGKPNVAKLANFDVVDCWCILGCGNSGIIIDENNEYYKPIITPYELKMALKNEVIWSGKWVTDFDTIMDRQPEIDKEEETVKEDYIDDDAPEFDSVTGKYIFNSRPLRRIRHLNITEEEEINKKDDENSNALVKKFSSNLVLKNTVSTSALHFQEKLTWTGLGSDFTNKSGEPGALVEQGINGIARGYSYTGGKC